MIITDDFLTVNKYSRSGYKRQDTLAVVLHWIGSPGQTAKQVRNYFESLKNGVMQEGVIRSASANYIIDLDGSIIRTMPEQEIAYHCGAAGKIDPVSGKMYTDQARSIFGTKFTNYPYSPSYASIGVEMCHPDWSGKYTDATLGAALELCADLFKRYDKLTDPMTQIITHKQVVGWKVCPRWFCDYPNELYTFKEQVNIRISG